MQKGNKEMQLNMEDLYNFHLFEDKSPKDNNDDNTDDNTTFHSRFAETSNEQDTSLASDSENDEDTEFSFNEEELKP